MAKKFGWVVVLVAVLAVAVSGGKATAWGFSIEIPTGMLGHADRITNYLNGTNARSLATAPQ